MQARVTALTPLLLWTGKTVQVKYPTARAAGSENRECGPEDAAANQRRKGPQTGAPLAYISTYPEPSCSCHG